jgi:hypothetical protein
MIVNMLILNDFDSKTSSNVHQQTMLIFLKSICILFILSITNNKILILL